MGVIYKITNNINGKIYIGKTVREPSIRWSEHLQYSKDLNRYNTPLYRAIRKYGQENFSFSILVDNIENEDVLNSLETEFINAYQSTSHNKGYNVALGGDGGRTSSKLTEDQVKEIKNILSDPEDLRSFSTIGKSYGVSSTTIRSINQGIAWVSSDIRYPIRDYDTTGITLTRSEYSNIIKDIQNTTLSLSEIATKYNISESRMTAINHGRECYTKENKYYRDIYQGDFPIRKDKRIKNSIETFIPIFYDVLFTTNSLAKIGAKYGVEGNTIQYIITGKRRKELTQNFLIPMRKNLEENQKIFLSLYPEYKGDDA